MKGFAVFLLVALSIWAAIHAYVFWRLASVPWVMAHVSRPALIVSAIALWSSYLVARVLESRGFDLVGVPLEYAAAIWIGIVFLLFAALLATDVVTLGGWIAPRFSATLRGWAALAAGALALVALFQGLRPPVVRDCEVRLAGLPPERDGLVLVAVSDFHLGTLLGRRWLERVVHRIDDAKPDLVVIAGDLIDGDVARVTPRLPQLKQLRAPLGVWAVTGNHEVYAGLEPSVELIEQAGIRVLRDRWTEIVPGLVLAGVDDPSARRGAAGVALRAALQQRPKGAATILLSHSPVAVDAAAGSGVGLMLCGHTHAGQIWPFNFVVRLQFPRVAGRFQVGAMTLVISRGAGTWGPPMRLWLPGEILRIRLRAG